MSVIIAIAAPVRAAAAAAATKEGRKEGGIQMSILRARSSSPRPSMHNVRVPSFPLSEEKRRLCSCLPAPSFLVVLVLLAALDPFPISNIGFLAGSALSLLRLLTEAPPSPTLSLYTPLAGPFPCPFLKRGCLSVAY